MTNPQTQDEWTLHAINIQGVFFERWCQHIVSKSKSWDIASTNYPVEFPAPNGPIRGKESSLDILARRRDGLTLTIECKKNNPELVNWIFFPKVTNPQILNVVEILTEARQAGQKGWILNPGVTSFPSTYPMADDARETKGDYLQAKGGQKTKTSNAAINEAAFQVALARQAIFAEEISHSRSLGDSADPPERVPRQVYVPVIVTTAKLFLCHFVPDDINSETGEIDFAKAKLEEVSELVYEYSLPKALQHAAGNIVETLTLKLLDLYTRLHIVVVHSAAFASFLDTFDVD